MVCGCVPVCVYDCPVYMAQTCTREQRSRSHAHACVQYTCRWHVCDVCSVDLCECMCCVCCVGDQCLLTAFQPTEQALSGADGRRGTPPLLEPAKLLGQADSAAGLPGPPCPLGQGASVSYFWWPGLPFAGRAVCTKGGFYWGSAPRSRWGQAPPAAARWSGP